jgi:hypothetical protein
VCIGGGQYGYQNGAESCIKGFDGIGDRVQNKTWLKDCCENIVMCAKNL